MPSFHTTQWTTIVRAMDPSHPRYREAMEQLCQRYESPVREFVRHWAAYDDDRARDLVQGFFLSLLEGSGISKVDPTRGRFRNWLLGGVKNHVRSNRRKHFRERGNTTLEGVPLEDDKIAAPDRVFARRWALTVLENALTELAQSRPALSYPERFARVRPLLVGPASEDPRYDVIAAELGDSAENLRQYVKRLRAAMAQLIREEIRRLVDEESEVEDELRFLFEALSVEDPVGRA